MLNNFVGKDIINIGDMTPDQFQYLLDLSKMLKAEKMTGVDHARFHNKNVVAHFEWESTRTRCAFETSCHDLGLGFTYLSNSHFGNKETVKDSIRVFSEMYDAIVLRAQREEAYVREVADIATIPVINACCEGDHPTQMLADALTMQELLGNLKGRKLAFVGNCATTAMWYGRLCALLGMDFYAVGPDDERYQLCDSFKENIEDLFNKWAPNNEIVLTSDKEKLKGMDVVTTECWIYQNPDVHDEDLAATGDWTSLEYSYDAWLRHSDIMEPYRVTSDLMEDYVKNPDCLVMHMLPAYHNADMKLMQKFLLWLPVPSRTSATAASSPRASASPTSASRSTPARSSARPATASPPSRPAWPLFWASSRRLTTGGRPARLPAVPVRRKHVY